MVDGPQRWFMLRIVYRKHNIITLAYMDIALLQSRLAIIALATIGLLYTVNHKYVYILFCVITLCVVD